jgi:hypothetical protein
MSSPPYTGPSVPEMVATHTLAENIIKYDDTTTGNSILDEENLALLRRFVENPGDRDAILKDEGIEDGEGRGLQSLAGYVVLKHGKGDMLDGREIEMLREWFEKRGR